MPRKGKAASLQPKLAPRIVIDVASTAAHEEMPRRHYGFFMPSAQVARRYAPRYSPRKIIKKCHCSLDTCASFDTSILIAALAAVAFLADEEGVDGSSHAAAMKKARLRRLDARFSISFRACARRSSRRAPTS